jgi:uncharacterized membrane protein YfcA
MSLTLVLAALVGVLLGLMGGGGSILTVPLLLYAGLATRQAIATSLVVVGLAALAALVPHALAGRVRWKAGALFGGAGIVGAHLGARISVYLPETLLLVGFGVMMVATAVALYRCRRCDGEAPVVRPGTARAKAARLALQGLGVGAVTGLVGVGGGFLIVPALTLLGGLPTRTAAATSLFIIALNSLAGFTGHLSHAAPAWDVAVPLALACAVGGFAGSIFADRVPHRVLRRGFAVMVLALAAFGAVARVQGGRSHTGEPRLGPEDAGERGRSASSALCFATWSIRRSSSVPGLSTAWRRWPSATRLCCPGYASYSPTSRARVARRWRRGREESRTVSLRPDRPHPQRGERKRRAMRASCPLSSSRTTRVSGWPASGCESWPMSSTGTRTSPSDGSVSRVRSKRASSWGGPSTASR